MRLRGIDGPNAGSMVGGAGSEMTDVRRQENTGDVGTMSNEFADGDQGCDVGTLDHAPDIYVSLLSRPADAVLQGKDALTALLPAHSIVPSLATVTLATDTSSSGISWCEHLFSPKSQIRTLPPRSQLINSPWFG
jgi:hypothetical protein